DAGRFMSVNADITTTSATSRLAAASATVRGTGARISGRSATNAETPDSPVTSATTTPGSAIAAGKRSSNRLESINHQPLTTDHHLRKLTDGQVNDKRVEHTGRAHDFALGERV